MRCWRASSKSPDRSKKRGRPGLLCWPASQHREDPMATLAVTNTVDVRRAQPRRWLSSWQAWGTILIAPYLLVFLFFVVYPVGYGLWLARHPATYVHLANDPIFFS